MDAMPPATVATTATATLKQQARLLKVYGAEIRRRLGVFLGVNCHIKCDWRGFVPN
jgi:hypothetical protein